MDELDVLQEIKDIEIVSHSQKKTQTICPTCGVHANGRADYMNASGTARLRAEETKLTRRIDRFCDTKGIIGYFVLVVRRWRLIRELQVRFEVPSAMFFLQSGTHNHKLLYDPLDDYGLGRATTPTSIGGGFLKSMISTFRR